MNESNDGEGMLWMYKWLSDSKLIDYYVNAAIVIRAKLCSLRVSTIHIEIYTIYITMPPLLVIVAFVQLYRTRTMKSILHLDNWKTST